MLQQYIGVKIIQAEPKTLPVEGEGYRVVYPDGYESWSPKAAFEEAYRLTDDMNFGLAVEVMRKKNAEVSRREWTAHLLTLRINLCKGNVLKGRILQDGEPKGAELWLPCHEDLLADDWFVSGGLNA